jgi:glycosyltransferase involved in cell wall biosynthesis
MRELQRIHDAFEPHCVIGVTFLGALRATRLRSSAPLWCDVYGDQMAEMQANAFLRHRDRGIMTQASFLRQILARGDVFSTCSGAQRHALLGQLATAGRLNRATFGYEFAHVLPAAARSPSTNAKGLIRGAIVDPTAKVVLWCGGYNTWTDVDVLCRGLEIAMDADPRLHFVSVGGALPGCNSYARFQHLTASSRHAERFHLLGWLPAADVPRCYVDADIGVSLDAACYEAELGTRTRLAEMMAYGLPIVTTLACELSHTIQEQKLGLTFPAEDAPAFGRQLSTLSLDDTLRNELGGRARGYAMSSLSLERSTAPLTRWVNHPGTAPDRQPEMRSTFHAIEYAARAFVRQAVWSVAGLDQ